MSALSAHSAVKRLSHCVIIIISVHGSRVSLTFYVLLYVVFKINT